MEPGSRASKLEKLNRLTGIHLGLRYRIIIVNSEILSLDKKRGLTWPSVFWGRISQTYEARQEAKSNIFEYIEIFYNLKRKNSYLGLVSPMGFEYSYIHILIT